MGKNLVARLQNALKKRKYRILLAASVGSVLLDQATKLWVIDAFRLGESVPVISNYFNLTYVRNTGAAFGLLADAHPAFRVPFFLIVPVVALVIIGGILKKLPDGNIRMSLALSLVVGGAVGNLIDRAYLGYVVDFLDFHWRYQTHFPAFNIADTAISVGVGLMMLDLLLEKHPTEQ